MWNDIGKFDVSCEEGLLRIGWPGSHCKIFTAVSRLINHKIKKPNEYRPPPWSALSQCYLFAEVYINMADQENDEDIWDSWEDMAESGVRKQHNLRYLLRSNKYIVLEIQPLFSQRNMRLTCTGFAWFQYYAREENGKCDSVCFCCRLIERLYFWCFTGAGKANGRKRTGTHEIKGWNR